MSPLDVGETAPPLPGVDFGGAPVAIFFYKVTCPTCQLAAPVIGAFERAYPRRLIAVGQDPASDLTRFSSEYGMGVPSIEDAPPYPISDAYRVASVPTLYLVGDGSRLLESVGAWERAGFNRVAHRIAALTGLEAVDVSGPDDGLPEFKPG